MIMEEQGWWEIVEPPEGSSTGALTEAAASKDKKVRAHLFQCLSDDLLMQVAKKKLGKEVWDSLKARFMGADRVRDARLQTLKAEFNALKMKEEETVDQFAGKLMAMSVRYSNLGGTLDDVAMVKKLFDTMLEKFLNVVAGIEQFFDLKTVAFDVAVGRLKAFEERTRRGAGATITNSMGQLMLTQPSGSQDTEKMVEEKPRREVEAAAEGEVVAMVEGGEVVEIHLGEMEEVQEIKAISSVSNATILVIMQTGVLKQRSSKMKVIMVALVEARSLKHSCLQKLKLFLQMAGDRVCICMKGVCCLNCISQAAVTHPRTCGILTMVLATICQVIWRSSRHLMKPSMEELSLEMALLLRSWVKVLFCFNARMVISGL
jgi:hypothetical protein